LPEFTLYIERRLARCKREELLNSLFLNRLDGVSAFGPIRFNTIHPMWSSTTMTVQAQPDEHITGYRGSTGGHRSSDLALP